MMFFFLGSICCIIFVVYRFMDSTLQKTASALAHLTPNSPGPSKSFQVLVRSIGEAKTKHEEDRIMKREAVVLKEKMASRETNPVSEGLIKEECIPVDPYLYGLCFSIYVIVSHKNAMA